LANFIIIPAPYGYETTWMETVLENKIYNDYAFPIHRNNQYKQVASEFEIFAKRKLFPILKIPAKYRSRDIV
jgi:hypothetical protein